MTKTVTQDQAEDAVRTLLRWAGEDPAREGLLDTPRRVAKAYGDWFSGYSVDPREYLARTFEEVGGYNELTERFPLTQAYLQPSADEAGVFDFECKVNERFYGLTNFILGYHEHIIEIVEPESLIEHIKAHIGRINFLEI